MIKSIVRVPTKEYGYVEMELEYETPEEALIDYDRLWGLYNGEQLGLSLSDFKKVKLQMLLKGEFDPNLLDAMNRSQKWWVNETKKTYRDVEGLPEDEVVIE